MAAELHVGIAGVGVKADIKITVKKVETDRDRAVAGPTTRLLLEWESSTLPRLFPLMKAELSIYPLTPTETQLDFLGVYKPPFGAVGKTVDALVGHRIAEVSVHSFVSDVAGYLRGRLSNQFICASHHLPAREAEKRARPRIPRSPSR